MGAAMIFPSGLAKRNTFCAGMDAAKIGQPGVSHLLFQLIINDGKGEAPVLCSL
jgi:hypothetical protein